ncbi:MAG: hypothetical protein J0I20_07720 [Chloroflexi bacterium]|nr:hypothetical protein [Chloroflexota bacterium]OJV95304.1 MAG: hypothetical protein BGO39_25225 [Chloroflexi bacterium 54-19]
MAQQGTRTMSDYITDYENALKDYSEMGPLWAEMVFGDDFEAMKALFGRSSRAESPTGTTVLRQDTRTVKQL